jgi:hypothetical protein
VPVNASPGGVRRLAAGDVCAELVGAELWHVSIGGREVIRRLFVAVREDDWSTSVARPVGLSVREDANAFRVTLDAVNDTRTGPFPWSATIVGGAGSMRFELRGRAAPPLVVNRVGICVLHPEDSCRGRDYTITSPTGKVTNGRLPRGLLPQRIDADGLDWSAITEIQRLCLGQPDGGLVDFRFTGGPFAFEDQRNYADVTYKSCTQDPPVLPIVFRRRTELREGVEVRRVGGRRRRLVAGSAAVVCVGPTHGAPLPPVGMRLDATRPLDAAGTALLARVRPRFLRATAVDAREVSAAALAGVPLELELAAGVDEANDAARLEALRALPRGMLLRTFVRGDHGEPSPSAAARARSPRALGGGGRGRARRSHLLPTRPARQRHRLVDREPSSARQRRPHTDGERTVRRDGAGVRPPLGGSPGTLPVAVAGRRWSR